MKYKGRIWTISVALLLHSSYLLYYILRGRGITLPDWAGYPAITALCYWGGLQFDRAVFHAEKDPLTGLYNRRNADVRIARMMKDADRSGSKVFVLSIDCDNFKWINDTLNHQTGDNVLIEISEILRLESGKGRFAVRWGGDEFLLWGLCSGPFEVDETIHRLNRRIADLSDRMKLPVNVSIGSALYPDDHYSSPVLISLADRNMYNQKKA